MFCDIGPDQLGAPRLVQLAALVVLHRRALARGSELMLGLTSEPVDRWHRGELPEQFEHWRTAHDTRVPGREHVDERGRQLDDEDELWVLAGEGLAEACRDRDLMVTTRDAGVGRRGRGLRRARLRGPSHHAGRPTRAGLGADVARRTLRRRDAPAPRPAAGPIGCPSFPSADRRLLLRGGTSHELLVTPIPTQASGGAGRPRTHKFGGVVIAASSLGGRVVALVRSGDEVRCVVVGKRLRRVEEIVVALDDFDAALPDDGHLVSELAPLFYDRGDLLCRIGRDWWRLAIDRPPRRAYDVIAAAPGRQMDVPRVVILDGNRLLDGSYAAIGHDVIADALRVVVGGHATAWSVDERWHVRGPHVKPVAIEVDEACQVIGMAVAGRADDPALVSVSDAGALVRLRLGDGDEDADAVVRRRGCARRASHDPPDRRPARRRQRGDRRPRVGQPAHDGARHVTDARAPAFRGTRATAGFLLDAGLIGEAEARRRVIERWSGGARVHTLPDGRWLLLLGAPVTVRAERAPGLCVTETHGAYTVAAAQPDERGTFTGIRHGAVETFRLADPWIDPAAWLAGGPREVVDVEALDRPAVPTPVAPREERGGAGSARARRASAPRPSPLRRRRARCARRPTGRRRPPLADARDLLRRLCSARRPRT